jgi:AsmA-like protein
MKKRRILKWLAGIAGALFVALLALVLILPRLVDSEAAKEKIRLILSEKTGGNFLFDKIDFLWLPRPAVVIRGVKISIAEHSTAIVQSIKVQPAIGALVAGRWVLSRVMLEKPAVAARFAESDKPFNFEEAEQKIHALLAALSGGGERLAVAIDSGSAEIAIGEGLAVAIKDLNAQLAGFGNELEIELTARSDLGHKLRLEGKIIDKEGIITLSGLTGTVGRSSFSDLAVRVNKDAPRNFKIDAGSLSLDIAESSAFLLRFEPPRKTLAGLNSAQGRLNVASLFLTGPLQDPAQWTFRAAGNLESLNVNHAGLPAPLTVARAKFAATPDKLTLADAEAEMLDARLTVGGYLEKSKKAPLALDAAVTGTVGAQMKEWLSRQAGLPEQLAPRAPLRVGAGRVRWREGGELSVIGNLTVANGPKVSVDAVRSGQAVTVRELTLEDGAQRARMAIEVQKDDFNLSFKGAVDPAMLNKIFESSPLQGGSLQGDFEARGSTKQLPRSFLRGKLEGKNLVVPWKKKPVVVESFLLEAGGGAVTVRSAALRWQDSRLALSGKLVAEREAVRVDMDVSADRLAWNTMIEAVDREDDQGAKTAPLPAIHGTVRLKTDNFTFERFNLSPLRITADVSSSGIRAEIAEGAACGIKATGRAGITGNEIELDLQLSATEAALEPTTICLSGKRQDIKGTYSLKARITGRGDRERLPAALKGNFEFLARDGEFVRSPAMDATFDYLNSTGDFKFDFPDLNKQTFPFRRVSVKGKIDGESIVNDEIIIEASPYTITAQGRVDLKRSQVDVKGLVSVSMSSNQLIRRIPLIGAIVGGSLVGIPVRITGSLESPKVTYLSAADVGTELLNMPMRILGIPLDAMRLFTPSQSQPEKE